MKGILELFAPDGTKITASEKDLLQLEARSTKIKLYRRIFGDTPGTYWLVSARPGHVRMILEINLRKGDSEEWRLSWCSNGTASYSGWSIDAAVKTLTEHREPATRTEDGRDRTTQLPANVEQLARKHVYYVPGVKGLDDVRPQFAVQIVPADQAKIRLAKVTDADTRNLISEYAGRPVEIMELMLAVSFFCQENEGLTGKEMALARALTKQHFKLLRLAGRLSAQLTQG